MKRINKQKFVLFLILIFMPSIILNGISLMQRNLVFAGIAMAYGCLFECIMLIGANSESSWLDRLSHWLYDTEKLNGKTED